MQLPFQGRFSENPGWALRPAFGQNDWRTDTVWRQPGNARRIRRHLRGFGALLPNISVQYTGNPQADFSLQLQALGDWYSKYYQQAYSIAEQVISELRSRGYRVDVLQRPEDLCNPSAGCVDFIGHVVKLQKDGREYVAGTGDRGLYSRVNSVQEFVDMLEQHFSMYATPATDTTSTTTATTTATTTTTPTATTTATPTTTATAIPTATSTATTTPTSTTTSQYYSRSAVLSAPDGYRVGGRFTLKIQGAPSSQVSIRAWQNGNDHGTTPLGTTDSRGYYEISGVWGDEHAGQWVEIIYVGGEQVGQINFEITKPQTQPVNTVSVSIPSYPATDSGSTTQEPVISQDQIPSSSTQPDIVAEANSRQADAGSSMLPLLIGAGVVALILFSGGGRK